MDRDLIESAISSFNRKSGEKARLVEVDDTNDYAVIEFSGIEITEEANKYFEAFRLMLEKALQLPVSIEKIEKTNGSHLVKFSQNPNPAEEAISRIKKYYEGVTPESDEGYED